MEPTETTTQSTTTETGIPDDPSAPANMDEFLAALETAVSVGDEYVSAGPFEPTWESLTEYSAPEWFRDRKFGIYFHWGLYSVPAFKWEWYPKWMYALDRPDDQWGSEVYGHHVQEYGVPDEYPYEEFADGFTAENFDAEAWAELFDEANAGFAGPVVEHHDGWSNWQSGINPWNAAERGPERDLVGELETAIRDRDMKFVTTFHHGRPARPDRVHEDDTSSGYYSGAYDFFSSVTEGFPERLMYKNLDDEPRWDMWYAKLVEAIEQYEPDLVWHDSLHAPPDDVKRQYLAYNLNRAAEQDRGTVITYKEVEHRDTIGSDTLTLDYENDVADDLQPQPWLSDISISNGAWCYTQDQTYRSATDLVETLVEIVAKNGQMLLNLTPRADGTFPDPMVESLRGVGDWIDVNGEAIFETRPWETWNDGDSVRYTRSKDGSTLYAIVLGWPEGEQPLPSVPTGSGGTVELLGHGEIDHGTDGGDVVLNVPELSESERPSDHAVAFALDGFI